MEAGADISAALPERIKYEPDARRERSLGVLLPIRPKFPQRNLVFMMSCRTALHPPNTCRREENKVAYYMKLLTPCW